jgi:chorismate synthase
MVRFLTSGESHGKGLTVIVEGFPSGVSGVWKRGPDENRG